MEKICKQFALMILAVLLLSTGCGKKKEKDEWLEYAALDKQESTAELYEKALKEDILIVYTVTTRIADTKDAFEAEYPGLFVEIRDLRSPNLVEEVETNYSAGLSECDVVVCTDNSGDFKERLVDKGIVVPYLPADIAPHMTKGITDNILSFVNEAEILFYNSERFESCPIDNLWELTDERFKGRIYMPNPLRSFSTFSFCAATFEEGESLKDARSAYDGTDIDKNEAPKIFWEEASRNIIFTNSSDEVMEALGNGSADFGILVSSKLRFKGIGYDMEPVYSLNPFVGCRTSYSVMIARNSKNINAAKLFVRFLLGEADGKGAGYRPFITPGTWPARDDVPGVNSIPLEDIDLLIPDTDSINARRKELEAFWAEMIKKTTSEQ